MWPANDKKVSIFLGPWPLIQSHALSSTRLGSGWRLCANLAEGRLEWICRKGQTNACAKTSHDGKDGESEGKCIWIAR